MQIAFPGKMPAVRDFFAAHPQATTADCVKHLKDVYGVEILSKRVAAIRNRLGQYSKTTLSDDLLDRASIALEIAGDEGLSGNDLRAELQCDVKRAYAAADKLVELGYARKIPSGRGFRYVLASSAKGSGYPASETSAVQGVA